MTNRQPMQLRLHDDLKDWIRGEADRSGSSQNSEVVRAIRDRMDRVTQQNNPLWKGTSQ